MNTAGLSYLGAKAKPTAEAIARWCEREGLGYEFLPARGRHPRVRLSLNRQSRMVVFSGSPSDTRVIENVLQNVRKEARNLGWEPRKESPMEAPVVKSLADLPKLAEAPAVPESGVPKIPEKWRGKSVVGNIRCDELKAAFKRRNEWVANELDHGTRHADILHYLKQAGWDIQTESALDYMAMKARGYTAPKPGVPKPEPEVFQPRAPAERQATVDPLVLAIAEAIAPLIRDQLAKQSKALEALKAKADKWDAISGLVREA